MSRKKLSHKQHWYRQVGILHAIFNLFACVVIEEQTYYKFSGYFALQFCILTVTEAGSKLDRLNLFSRKLHVQVKGKERLQTKKKELIYNSTSVKKLQ